MWKDGGDARMATTDQSWFQGGGADCDGKGGIGGDGGCGDNAVGEG